jgi:lipoprotein-anchoring transpeptidase ErfK/SrfK
LQRRGGARTRSVLPRRLPLVRNRFAPILAAVLIASSVAVGGSVLGPVGTVSAAADAGAYVPMARPERLVDTRNSGALGPGVTISVQVTGDAPLPATGTVTAAVLNVTVVGPAGAGFWSVWPSGSPRPNASSLNIDEQLSFSGARVAVPNMVTVPVSASGVVDVFSSAGGHVLVDLLGYYTSATSATSGRFEPLNAPNRIVDTRNTTLFGQGESRTFAVPGAVGASAVAVNVTAISVIPGYWQLFAAGTDAPATSNLNSPTGLGAIVANQAIVPVDASGSITVFSQSGGHLLIDLVGIYTGAGAADSEAGLFVSMPTPRRVVDTRDAAINPLGGTSRALPGWRFEVPVSATIGSTDVAAVALNATITETLTVGFVSVVPAGAVASGTAPSTSTMNILRPGQTLANHAIVPVSSRGFSMFAQGGGHLIADLAGYFIGTPVTPTHPAPTNANPTPFACPGFANTAVGPLASGSSRASVAAVQQRLLDLGFWNMGPDGRWGLSTSQSVMAFQKWKGLPATTVVDVATAIALNTTLCRPVAGGASGDLFEVDKSLQIAYVVRGGSMRWVFNVSTGNGKTYDEEDQKNAGRRVIGTAITPNGNFRIYRVHDQVRYEGDLGTLYRPRFVVGGVAVHGAPNVPNYPASHGCIRVANPVMDFIWGANLLPLRSSVWIHE